MKEIRVLLVIFENKIPATFIPSFRGAIVARVGRKHEAFHNHNGGQLVYQYPSIQYKLIKGKAALLCLGKGVEEIHHFFGLKSWDIQLQNDHIDLKVDHLNLHTLTMKVGDKMLPYSIINWLALNADNYKKYQSLGGLVEKISFLEKLLTGNILSFAKGIDWHIEMPVKVEIQQLKGQKMIRYKGVPLLAFDVTFRSNVFLPDYLGLGKSASHGYGVIYQNKNNSK